ncbi:AAA family ATPase [Limnoglobus roseus]|uniref:ATP-binding protein n=1 Tax=Limnoglobus roseus TaxID=2598579 RepID=A0A5C1A9D2_9BACT|nr:ATP-binding protein [Limnoglobus roseus]QEL15811.1 ATP-binding protein [Limnoglobus roseus]
MPPLSDFTADHRLLVTAAAQAAGFRDPVAFDADDFEHYLLKKANRGRFVPLDGVFIRDWDPDFRKTWPGMNFGLRLYHLSGITFVRSYVGCAIKEYGSGYDFLVCDRSDYTRLYRLAKKLRRDAAPPNLPPVMAADVQDKLWQNTIGYLEPKNLAQIRRFGGRAKRGLLLTGPPGNGKTSACRWIYQECVRRNWDYRLVTADDYASARRDDDPGEAVRELFKVSKQGVVFFDDLDIALRDRDTVKETDDQSVFLTCLDGISGNEAVVYVFTTNCDIKLIDPAFRRPGRIDLTLPFPKPNADLRRRLVERWDAEIRATIGVESIVADSDGFSFAELDELKNLLIVHYLETQTWDWDRAKRVYRENRADLASGGKSRLVGFGLATVNGNGHAGK